MQFIIKESQSAFKVKKHWNTGPCLHEEKIIFPSLKPNDRSSNEGKVCCRIRAATLPLRFQKEPGRSPSRNLPVQMHINSAKWACVTAI